MPIHHPRQSGKALKKVIIALAAIILVLVGAIIIALPPIAASFITGRHEVDLPSGRGAIELRDVSIAWGGPQKVGQITLIDPQGKPMTNLSAQAQTSILSALLGGGNIGTVQLSGSIDVTEDQLTPPPGTASSAPPQPPSPSSTPGAPANIPPGLRATLEARPINITYTPRPAAGLPPITITDLAVVATVLGSGEATLTIGAQSPTIDVKGAARNFVTTRGELSLSTAEGELDATINAPGELVEALTRLALKQAATSSAPATPAAPTELSAHIKIAAGRLRLADTNQPITAKGPVPKALIDMLAGPGATVSLDSSPSLNNSISALDLPLPDAAGKVDLRGSSLHARLTTTPITGAIALDGGQRKPFRVEPIDFDLLTDDFNKVLTLRAETRGSFEGNDAGALELNAEAEGLLDPAGMIRAGLPSRLTGILKLTGVPTRLADSFIKDPRLSIVEVVGPAIDAELNIGTKDAATLTPGAVPPARITARIAAANLNAALNADIDSNNLHLASDGLTLTATRLLPAIRAYTADQNLKFSGDGALRLTARNITVPLMSGGLPDLGRLAGVLTLTLDHLVIDEGAGDRPLTINSLDNTLTLSADAAPKLTMKHDLASGGRPFTAAADLDLQGLITRRDKDWPFVEFTPSSIRPSGTIEVNGLPSDLLGYVPAEMRAAADTVLGPDINIRAQGTRDAAGKSDLALHLTGEGIDVAGSFALDATSIRTTNKGLAATINNPGPLVQSILQRQPDSPVAAVNWNTPLSITLPTLNAPMPHPGTPYPVDQVDASLTLTGAGVAMDVRAPGADRPERITAENFNIALAQTNADGASVTLDSKGSYAGEAFTINGALALGKLMTSTGLDLAALAPKGKIEALSVPTALIAAFDAKNGSLLRDAAGERADLTITAPALQGGEGAAAGPRSASIAIKSSNLNATTSVSMADTSMSLGETAVALTLSPALVQNALAQYAPDINPRPALQKNARVNLTVFPTSLGLTPDKKPDMNTIRPVRAMLTSPDDLVLLNLPGGGDGKPMNAGLRGLEAGLTWNQQEMLKREGSLKARLFEPSEPNAVIAEIDADAVLINPPPTFEAKIDNIDTARVDKLLGRPGLLSDLMGDSAGIGATGRAKAGTQDIDLVVKSDRLSTSLALQNTKEALRLTAPGAVNVNVPAEWANRYVFAPAATGERPAIQLASPVALALKLQRFAIAHSSGYFKPGVFALEASASAPSITLRTADGQTVDIQSLTADLKNDDARRSIAFDINTKQVGIAGAGRTNPVRAVGEITGLADQSGTLTTDLAALTAKINGTLPTAVLDALANQKGMLVDLLGKMTTIELDAAGLSKQAGSLAANVNTDNAKASIRGSVRDAVFITEGPTTINLSRITPELSARYIETTIPLLSRVEKTTEDEPATVNATGLTLPTDGDTHKINGTAQIDPGTLRFNTSDFFGQLVKLAGARGSGQVGKRIKPFEFVAREGVVTYEKIELPIGEFNVWTRGKVDLNTRKMDIVTFVPFSALAEEIAGSVKNIPGIEALTMIPIRTHGSFDNPKSEIQLDLIVKEALPGALDKVIPEDIKKIIPPEIGEGLKDLFKKKDKNKKN